MADVFVDRDGVINRNRSDHVKTWSEFAFLPGSVEALVELSRAGHRIFVITNQAIVNRGVVPTEMVSEINRRMVEEVARLGGIIQAVLVCPHVPEERCLCRKPLPGLLLQARAAFGAVLEEAYAIGDFSTDLEAARAVGCVPILVLTGRGRQIYERMSRSERQEYWVARDLRHAVKLIGTDGQRRSSRSVRGKQRYVRPSTSSPAAGTSSAGSEAVSA